MIERRHLIQKPTLVIVSSKTKISFQLPVCKYRSDLCDLPTSLSNAFFILSIITTILGIGSACLAHLVFRKDNQRVVIAGYLVVYFSFLTKLSAFFMINSGVYLTVIGKWIPQSKATLLVSKICCYFDNVFFSSIAFICLWATIAELKVHMSKNDYERRHPGNAQTVCTVTVFMCLAWNLFNFYVHDICVYWKHFNHSVEIGYGVQSYYIDAVTTDMLFIPAITTVVYSIAIIISLFLLYSKISRGASGQCFSTSRQTILKNLGNNSIGFLTSIALLISNFVIYRQKNDPGCNPKYEIYKRCVFYGIALTLNVWYPLITIANPVYEWWKTNYWQSFQN